MAPNLKPEIVLSRRALEAVHDTRALRGLLEPYYGNIKPSLMENLALTAFHHWRNPRVEQTGLSIWSQHGGDISKSAYLRDFFWGRAAFFFIVAIMRGAVLEPEGQFGDLMNQIARSAQDSLGDDLETVCSRGRGLIATSVHPAKPWILGQLVRGPLETIIIRQSDAADPDDRVVSISTKHGPQTIILRIVKQLRAGPKIVIIYPDGPYGSERMFHILGKFRLDISAGAAALAWHTGSDLFFIRPTWTELGPGMKMVEGPAPEAFSDFESYKNAFFDFYMGEVLRLMRLDPKSVGGWSGVWVTFHEQQDRSRQVQQA